MPTVVKLDVVTLELSVLPSKLPALTLLAVMPDSVEPLPKKKPPAVIFAVAEILPLLVNTPVTVAPEDVTVTTLATFDAPIKIEPLFSILILLVPLAMPETPPDANN